MLQPDTRTVVFFNPFEKDFTHTWDKTPFTIKSGEKKMFPKWLADHMVKHIVDRELNLLRLPTDFHCSDPANPNMKYDRSALEAKCVIDNGAPSAGSSLADEIARLNAKPPEVTPDDNRNATTEIKPWCDTCDSKGVRHKKDCPKYKAVQQVAQENADFAGLTT